MPTFSLVSFNCHAGLRPRRHGVCEPYDLVEVLRSFDADVIVVQEAWWPADGPAAVEVAAEAIGASLHGMAFGGGTIEPWPHLLREGPGTGRIGLAILSRLPAQRVGTLMLGHVPFDPAPERGGIHVALDVEGARVDLVGIHLTSRLPHGPPVQMRRLAPQLPGPDAAAVVAGDCNFWGPGVETFLPGWRRAVRGRTWPARLPHSQIDHVLVRPRRIGVESSAVLPDVGSDHRPVRAVLAVT